MNPPTKDAFESLMKMYKSSNDWYQKEAVCEALKLIVEAKCMNFDLINIDLLKFISKSVVDKSEEV